MYGLVVQRNGYGEPKQGSYNKSRVKVINPSSVRPVRSVNVEPSRYANPMNDVPEPKPKVTITPTQLFSGGYHDRKEFERAYQIYDILVRRGPAGLSGSGSGFGGGGIFGGGSLFPQSNRLTSSKGFSTGGSELLGLSTQGTPAGVNAETQTNVVDQVLESNSSTNTSSTNTSSTNTSSTNTLPSSSTSTDSPNLSLRLGDYIRGVINASTGSPEIESPVLDEVIDIVSSVDLMEVDSPTLSQVSTIVSNQINENNDELNNLRDTIDVLSQMITYLEQNQEPTNEENQRLLRESYEENQRLIREGNALLQQYERINQEYIAAVTALQQLQDDRQLPPYAPQMVEGGTQMSPESYRSMSIVSSPASSSSFSTETSGASYRPLLSISSSGRPSSSSSGRPTSSSSGRSSMLVSSPSSGGSSMLVSSGGPSPIVPQRRRRSNNEEDERRVRQRLEFITRRQSVSGGGRRTAITHFINRVKRRVQDERGFPSLRRLALDSVFANVRRSARNFVETNEDGFANARRSARNR
jgi:hypothetical protein